MSMVSTHTGHATPRVEPGCCPNNMSVTEAPLYPTQVFIEPLFTRNSPKPAAQSVSHLPFAVVLLFPHCMECALKSPRTSIWRGRHLLKHSPISSRKSPNALILQLGEM